MDRAGRHVLQRRDRPDPDPGGEHLFGYGIEQGCLDTWRHEGFATVAGRLTHHLACDPLAYWIDVETGMVLRFERVGTFAEPYASIHEVVSLEEGPQDPARFELPEGAIVH